MEMMKMVLLDELEDLSLHLIALKLGPKDTAVLACVNKRLRDSAAEDTLWRTFCQQDLRLSDPLDPSGNPTDSFKAAYQIWREAFLMYPWPIVKRVKTCWDTLKNWMAINFPEAANTLQKGASESDIKLVEDKLGVKLPLSTKLLYRFCDGQQLPDDDVDDADFDEELGSPLGVIGGYSFYDHHVNVYLLPLAKVITKTKEFVRHLGFSSRSKYIVVASSSSYIEKLFFLNCVNGQLYVGTTNLSTEGEMMPCVSVPAKVQRDAMLLWLEEHGRRLESGIIRLREEGKLRRINLFPETTPLCSTAVTNGVQIRSSAVFVPELANLQAESQKYWFSYSIRMRLLSPFASCQLYWRHWIIRAKGAVVSDVNGEAVIGQYPRLRPDKKDFVYESCTPLPSCPGSVEGSFTFVPGRIIANRQSAARSKQRKQRYIAELEQKERVLRAETVTLSAKLAIVQSGNSSMKSQNEEMRLRLQELERERDLKDAQNARLKEEVRHLQLINRKAVANGRSMMNNRHPPCATNMQCFPPVLADCTNLLAAQQSQTPHWQRQKRQLQIMLQQQQHQEQQLQQQERQRLQMLQQQEEQHRLQLLQQQQQQQEQNRLQLLQQQQQQEQNRLQLLQQQQQRLQQLQRQRQQQLQQQQQQLQLQRQQLQQQQQHAGDRRLDGAVSSPTETDIGTGYMEFSSSEEED